MSEPEKLPPWLEEKIATQLAEGISMSIRWRLPMSDPDHGEVAAIYWRPGDPNALAAILKKYVHGEPVPLELDGEKFMITREDWPDDWDTDT